MPGPPSIVSSSTAPSSFQRSSYAMPICVPSARSRLLDAPVRVDQADLDFLWLGTWFAALGLPPAGRDRQRAPRVAARPLSGRRLAAYPGIPQPRGTPVFRCRLGGRVADLPGGSASPGRTGDGHHARGVSRARKDIRVGYGIRPGGYRRAQSGGCGLIELAPIRTTCVQQPERAETAAAEHRGIDMRSLERYAVDFPVTLRHVRI
jgi:hypothetical protein